MIGLVLVTHGNLAKEFISAMQHVVGRQEPSASARKTTWKCAAPKF